MTVRVLLWAAQLSCHEDMNANKSTQREQAEEQELQGWAFFLLIVVT